MKTLIVYYSLEGNTDMIAKAMAEKINADLLRIKPVNDYKPSGAGKYFTGGTSVLFKKKPPLETISLNPGEYDLIIIGSPVWAGSFAPPLRTFFSKDYLKGKKTALFCCHRGGKGKIFQNMEKALTGNEILGSVDFENPLAENRDMESTRAKEWAASMTEKAEGK